MTIFGVLDMLIGQAVAWPQAVKAMRVERPSLSLATYVLLMISMSLYFVHASMIGDIITCISAPLALVPNAVILARIVRDRRRTSRGASSMGGDFTAPFPRAVSSLKGFLFAINGLRRANGAVRWRPVSRSRGVCISEARTARRRPLFR